ncbi:MAG: TonB-dependent receptor domain-containing protein [Fidelibacterota bacterium]
MIKKVMSFLMLYTLSALSAATVSGFITDYNSQEPLVGVNVFLKDTNLGSATDRFGYYEIAEVVKGKYSIVAQMIGYEMVSSEIIITDNDKTTWSRGLKSTVVNLPEVAVTGEKMIEITSVSDISLSQRMMVNKQGHMEDPIQVIQTMPGVTGNQDLFSPSQLYIRGGGPDENLFLLDWVKVYWPWYMGGIKSIFNSDVIEKIELQTGGFPAKYGNTLSSVLNVTTREGDRDHYSGSLSQSFMNMQAMFEGPLTSKGSFLATSRRTYLDLIMDESAEFPITKFSDLNFKVVYDLREGQKLSLNSFTSSEHTDYLAADPEPGVPDRIKVGNSLTAQSLEWNSVWSSKFFSRVSVLYSYSDASVGVGRNFDMNINARDFGLREDNVWEFSPVHELKTGFELAHTIFSLNANMPLDPRVVDPTDTTVQMVDYDISENSFAGGAYLQDTWDINKRVIVTGGVRMDYLSYNKITDVSPRFSMKYHLSGKTGIRLAWGKYYQFPQLEFLSKDKSLKSKMATHYIVGLSHSFSEEFSGWMEVYYKKYDQLITIDTLENHTNDGKGYSKGVEIFLQKRLGRFNGWISYALSEAKRKEYMLPKEVYFDYDNRHMLSTVFQYEFPNPGKIIPAFFQATFRYSSGTPYTPVIAAVQNQTGQWYPVYGEDNSKRYEAYHNLNVRFGWNFTIAGKYKAQSFMEIWNVYNRKNILRQSYQYGEEYPNNVKVTRQYTTPFLPAGGFMIMF